MKPSITSRMTGVAAATTLALWCHAWQAGTDADRMLDVLGEIGLRSGVRAASAEAARRSGLPGPGEPSAPVAHLLPLLRSGGRAALITPVPGDLRGLPPGGDVLGPAMDSGAVVVLPAAQVGLVPADGQWRAFAGARPHPALGIAEATWLVDEAVSAATRLLIRADVASDRGRPREELLAAARVHAVLAPPGLGAAAAALLDRSTALAAMLQVAGRHPTAAVTGHQAQLVDAALAPLHAAVREARRAVVGAGPAR